MKLRRTFFMVPIFFYLACSAFAGQIIDEAAFKDIKARIEEAYYTDNKNETLAQIKRVTPFLKKEGSQWYAHYYLSFCYNHLAMLCLTTDEAQARKHVDKAFEHVDAALKIRETAELYVLCTSIMGKKITLGPTVLRMTRGLEALAFMDKARELDPDMPGVVFEHALTEYHTPENFGGGVEKAKAILRKNLKILDTYSHKDPLYLDWHLRVDNLAWLAYMEAETGNLGEAAAYFREAAALRPDHVFLHDVVGKKLNEKKDELLRTRQEGDRDHG